MVVESTTPPDVPQFPRWIPEYDDCPYCYKRTILVEHGLSDSKDEVRARYKCTCGKEHAILHGANSPKMYVKWLQELVGETKD